MRITLSDVQRNIAAIANRAEYTPDIIYELLAAYGRSPAAITQLRTGHLNKAEDKYSVLQKDIVYFRTFPKGTQLEPKVQELYEDPFTERYKPRYLVATDLINIAAKDTVKGTTLSIKLADIDNELDFFYAWTGDEVVDTKTEAVADRRAADRMNELYVEIEKENQVLFAKNANFRHELNVFFTRLLFCFFAEDTGIYKDKQFTDAIKKFTQPDGSDLSWFFGELFLALNTKKEDKPNLKKPFSDFPYVNGSIFDTVKHSIAIPVFSAQARHLIMECGRQNWSEINPDIFGTMFQGIVDPDRRDESGMDYTSVPNIMKVIQPLFLDELHEQYVKHYDNEKKLWALLNRISAIKIFDPACGSGNFLIISYKNLRQIQHKIIARIDELKPGGLGGKIPSSNLLEVDHLYGVEIDDFARELAILSIFLAKHQMNMEFNRQFGTSLAIIPLIELSTIVHGNAAKIDWQTVCPNIDHTITAAEQSSLFELEGEQAELKLGETTYDEIYLIGNPPYKGFKMQTSDQKNDIKTVFAHRSDYKKLDYICCWIFKAAEYIHGTSARSAFVTTSSINQGEHVGLLWPDILRGSIEISFAWRPFKWTNSARDAAGVVCVIVGLRNKATSNKYIYDNNLKQLAKNINPYLVDGANILVAKRSKPISDLPKMTLGNMPKDDGNFLLSKEELGSLPTDQRTNKYVRKALGAKEFLNGGDKWCIWIMPKDANDAYAIEALRTRIDKVKEFRLSSSDKSANQMAKTPYMFREQHVAKEFSIIVPTVTSERREYLPMGILDKETVVLAPNNVLYDPPMFVLSLLSSKMHSVWLRTVAGYLGTSFRYSSVIVYNNFPIQPLTQVEKDALGKSARRILLARAAHPEKTLANMYDPDKMPANLRIAHSENDHLVDNLYKKGGFTNDEDRLSALFGLYENMTSKEKAK